MAGQDKYMNNISTENKTKQKIFPAKSVYTGADNRLLVYIVPGVLRSCLCHDLPTPQPGGTRKTLYM